MKRWILCLMFVLLATTVHAETLGTFLNSVRMIMMDRGSPKAFEDTVYRYHAANALQYIGSRSLCVTVDTAIPLVDNTLLYTLARPPLSLVTAYSKEVSGAITGIPRVPQRDIWKKDAERESAYSIGPDGTLFITRPLSYKDTLVIHYATSPAAFPTDSSTAIDLPAGLLPALHYQTAADVLDATRFPLNMEAAARWAARGESLIQTYLAAIYSEPLDSLAIHR